MSRDPSLYLRDICESCHKVTRYAGAPRPEMHYISASVESRDRRTRPAMATTIKTPARGGAARYETDFVAWAEAQAEALRAGRLDELDLEHLAEEIQGLAERDRRELRSRLRVLVAHLLKWRHQPDHRSRSWRATILTQRADLDDLFESSPSLGREVPDALARA